MGRFGNVFLGEFTPRPCSVIWLSPAPKGGGHQHVLRYGGGLAGWGSNDMAAESVYEGHRGEGVGVL